MKKYLIIGAGRVGRALHLCLKGSVLVHSRSLDEQVAQMIDAETVVLLACRDSALSEYVTWLKATACKMNTAVHFTGSVSHEVLSPLLGHSEGIARAHPCRIISEKATTQVFRGGAFHLTGNEAGLQTAQILAKDLCMSVVIDPIKSFELYHCALYFVVAEETISEAATHIARVAGMTDACLQELAHSIFTSEFQAKNPTTVGPVARGDLTTIQHHLMALRCFAPECVEKYKLLFRIPEHL